jgi:hypothetical protein
MKNLKINNQNLILKYIIIYFLNIIDLFFINKIEGYFSNIN